MKKLFFYLCGTFPFRLATFWELSSHTGLVLTVLDRAAGDPQGRHRV